MERTNPMKICKVLVSSITVAAVGAITLTGSADSAEEPRRRTAPVVGCSRMPALWSAATEIG
jgi:hypothetical protein